LQAVLPRMHVVGSTQITADGMRAMTTAMSAMNKTLKLPVLENSNDHARC